MLRSNIIANFLGTTYGMILQFLMIPVTLHYLGPQTYGLIGIYAAFLAVLAVLDLGLAPALARELSKLSAMEDGTRLMRSTVTTLEAISLCSAIGVGLLIWTTAPFLAEYWFTNRDLPVGLVSKCLQWLGLQSAFQFLANYYNNGLMGLQRIRLSNWLAVVTQTVRAIALIWVLVTISDIESYFICQTLMGLVNLLVTAFALYRVLSTLDASGNTESKQSLGTRLLAAFTNRYSHERFLACRRFAGGMAATAVSTLALTQLDKIILSKMLSLENFGFYTIATGIASLLAKPASIVLGAVLPHMTQLATKGDASELTHVYLRASTLVSWMVLPAAGILIGFSEPLLSLYLQNPQSAYHIAPLVAALAVGNALHSITFVPYGLTLAYGWARFGVNFGLIGSLTLAPLIVLATKYHGAFGAAAIWGLLCLSYVTIFMVVIHQRYLIGILGTWYMRVCVLPGLACVSVGVLGIFLAQR